MTSRQDYVNYYAAQRAAAATDLNPEEYGPFSERQSAVFWFQIGLTQALGKYDQSSGPDGAHYFNSAQNPFTEEGLACGNCAFFEGTNTCEIVDGNIDPQGLCKNWIIPEGMTKPLPGDQPPAPKKAQTAMKKPKKPKKKWDY
jgi:hypothetical protein